MIDEEEVYYVDLKAMGLERLPDVDETLARERAEALKKKRFVDLGVAAELVARGWKQAGPGTGLLWCSVCQGPTVWVDAAGRPSHHSCAEWDK